MNYRLHINWTELNRSPFTATGTVQVHIFPNGSSFATSKEQGVFEPWIKKHEFLVVVTQYTRSYKGIRDGFVPKLSDEVMDRLGILVDSYCKGFKGDDNTFFWYQEPNE